MMFECIDKIYPSVSIDTVIGSICTFTDNIGGLPLKSCTSLITGYQEGSGTPSPDNVRPLHAWSGANLTACGVNLWDEEYLEGYYNSSGVFNSQTGQLCTKNKIAVKPNTNYYLGTSINLIPTNTAICYYDKSGTIINRAFVGKGVFTTPSNCYYINVNFGSIYGGTYLHDLCVNYPSTDTDYHAYNGNTHTFSFGQSIYQGYIDWKRGVVVGTIGVIVFDGSSDEIWRTYSGQRYTVPVSDFTSPSNSQLANIICDKLETITKAQQGSRTFVISGSDADSHDFMVNVGANSYNDMIDWLNANPITVAYELATPIEIPLGGINLLTQQGVNNIFCDTGDTTVEYINIT